MKLFGMLLCGFMLIALVSGGIDLKVDSNVIELNDDNFEHDTQAASGATTGDWFILFYANWCSHCADLMPTWELLADSLFGQVNVARIDAAVNRETGTRFSIQGFPTAILFHHGKYFEFNGGRDLAEMEEFARGGYLKTLAVTVPPPLSSTQVFVQELKTILTRLQMVVSEAPESALIIFTFGILIGALLSLFSIYCCFPVQSEYPEPTNTKKPIKSE